MVNTLINISAYPESIPADAAQEGADLTIRGGPLYESRQVLALVRHDGGQVEPWTKKCVKDLREKFSIDHDGAAELVREAITSGNFRNSSWCRGNKETLWAACDAYVLKREEYIRHAHKYMEIEYYVKFAIHQSGKLLLLISCHNPEDRG